MRLQLEHISKQFLSVKALDDVQLNIQPGEVHAVCGENGAGKSTLMNIIAGNIQTDKGIMRWNGEPFTILRPTEAITKGIAIVYQHLSLIESLDIAENIFANDQPLTKWGLIDHDLLYKKTEAILHQLSLQLDGHTLISKLSPAQKQLVEIAKALAKNPQLLILDEPTASLSEPETQNLFSILKHLKQEGVSVIYISHRLKEIFTIADTISILKDGRYQGSFATTALTENQLIEKMVGREIIKSKKISSSKEYSLLEIKNLSGKKFKNIAFKIKAGEIVGFAGLVGSGRTEIARAIIGADKKNGEIFIHGKPVKINHPADSMQQRIAYVPEERKSAGLFMDMSVAENIVASSMNSRKITKLYNTKETNQSTEMYRQRLRIATPDIHQHVRYLSGGNQQKVVLSKWLVTDPEILIIDEPTHGVDVGAKFEIYEIIKKLVTEGKGVLLISSELPELLYLSDRIIVIRKGEIAGELDADEATEEKIIALAT